MIVAAHPDDETIGVGGTFPRLGRVTLVHLTDGAPKDLVDAERSGFRTREAYASARRSELLAALRLAGLGREVLREIGLVDQEGSLHLERAARRLAELFKEIGPEVVFTHPYEGGHPDHDASAFAVQAAYRLIAKEGGSPPARIEFASYHRSGKETVTGEFLAAKGFEAITVALSGEARARKRNMFDCFTTQREVLSAFSADVERFRPAPTYDFTRPPHPGPLYYESQPWGMSGTRWRELASEALGALGLLKNSGDRPPPQSLLWGL
jgi:LmbE family N-acetylglucosaminyl deacetylase